MHWLFKLALKLSFQICSNVYPLLIVIIVIVQKKNAIDNDEH